MAIGLRGVGALVTTVTNSLTITLPSGGSAPQAGDLIICHIGAGQDVPEPAYSSGMTGYALRGSKLFLDYGPGGITQWIYWKIAGSSESSPSITINDGSDGLWGYAIVFSGVDNASPFDLAAVSQGVPAGSSQTYTPADVTTQTANAWVVSLVQTSDDNGLSLSTTQGFTLAAGGTSYMTTDGLDASFGAAYKLIASPGTVTPPTWNQDARSPDYWAYQTIGLTVSAAGTHEATFTANAVKKRTQTGSFTANAVIKRTQTGSTTAASWILGYFRANATLKATISGTPKADAILKRTQTGSTTANAILLRVQAGTPKADAVLRKTINPTFLVDAIELRTFAPTTEAFSWIKALLEKTFTVDYEWAQLVTSPVWTTPVSGVGISSTPSMAFEMPDIGKSMHFHMQFDTADTFDTGDLREYKSNFDQTGWEYWDGGGWQAVPATGVPDTYAGNEARYTIQAGDELTTGTWYRRVRAG